MTVKEAIRELAGNAVVFRLAKVLSIDNTARTCEIEYQNGGTDPQVRLQAKMQITGGWLLIPTVGSDVIIAYLNKNTAFVILCSEVDKVIINGGNNDGLVNIVDLTTKLNQLISEIKTLKQDYVSHTHPTPSGPSSAPTVPFTGTFSNFNKTDYEDINVTH